MPNPLLSTFASAVLLAALPLQAATLAPAQQATHVLNRLAFGPKPGDIERVTQMGVQRYIDSQLDPKSIPVPADLRERLALLGAINYEAGRPVAEYLAMKDGDHWAHRRGPRMEELLGEARTARLLRAVESPRQLEEVLVDFWYNHFNVPDSGELSRALIASYERDAIRPYVLGSFRQMLRATARHPAMLNYLGHAAHARALMEAHTLGPGGAYTEHDVSELARMLSGWTFDARRMAAHNETFRFDPGRHDTGSKTWLGRRVAPAGQREGEMALDVLAAHPATARHLSYKLAQYFVRDDPPPALVERMARKWRDAKGDIRQVLRVLFVSEEFMAPSNAGAKFKTPYRFVISAVRASGAPLADTVPLAGALDRLHMPLYGAPAPQGYRDAEQAWNKPDALPARRAFADTVGSGRLAAAAAAQAHSGSAAPPARAATASDHTPTGAVAPSTPYPAVTATRSAAKMAAASPMPPSAALDAGRLRATLGDTFSAATLETVASSPVHQRAALLLGSADFMRH